MPKKLTTHQRLSRRETFRLAGAAGAMALVGRNIAGESCAAQDASALSCVVSPPLTEGPYFVDEKLNRSDLRYDPSDNRPGDIYGDVIALRQRTPRMLFLHRTIGG